MSETREVKDNCKRKLEEATGDEFCQNEDNSNGSKDQVNEVKKPSMPTYGKYNILKILKENHCLISDREQLLNAFPRNKRYDADEIKNFVDKAAKKSQALTEVNNRSIEFERVHELIKVIEAQNSLTDRSLDVPLSLKTITDVYEYEEDDVDLRMIYQTLTNLSLGFPTGTLDATTNAFLYGVYKDFLDQVHTQQFQDDVQKYQNFINNRQKSSGDIPEEKHYIGNDIHQVVKSALSCPSINPLNIPFSLLHKPKNSF